VVDACTLAVLFPLPDEVEARAVAELTPLFAETLLCVDRVEPYLRQGLGMVTPWLGASRILSAIHAALAVAQHEQVLAVDGAGGLELNPFQLRYLSQHPSPAQVLLFAGEDELLLLPGRYRRACLKPLERALKQGISDPSVALRGLRIEKIDEAETEFI
jgi:molybdopterin-guanine dinucleotide biosynthesis protein A